MTFSAADDAGRNALVKSGVATKFFFNRANQLTDTVASNVGAFDPKSITMLTGDHYAKDTTKPVFTVPANTQVGTLARLSVQDCQALMSMYGRNCPVTGTGSRPTCTSLDRKYIFLSITAFKENTDHRLMSAKLKVYVQYNKIILFSSLCLEPSACCPGTQYRRRGSHCWTRRSIGRER